MPPKPAKSWLKQKAMPIGGLAHIVQIVVAIGEAEDRAIGVAGGQLDFQRRAAEGQNLGDLVGVAQADRGKFRDRESRAADCTPVVSLE